jgi:hypothetical protein
MTSTNVSAFPPQPHYEVETVEDDRGSRERPEPEDRDTYWKRRVEVDPEEAETGGKGEPIRVTVQGKGAKGSPPSLNNRCHWCQSPEHFKRDCPQWLCKGGKGVGGKSAGGKDKGGKGTQGVVPHFHPYSRPQGIPTPQSAKGNATPRGTQMGGRGKGMPETQGANPQNWAGPRRPVGVEQHSTEPKGAAEREGEEPTPIAPREILPPTLPMAGQVQWAGKGGLGTVVDVGTMWGDTIAFRMAAFKPATASLSMQHWTFQ